MKGNQDQPSREMNLILAHQKEANKIIQQALRLPSRPAATSIIVKGGSLLSQ
jgi:hypothetical protein